jgi:hypothetical protein
VSEEDAAAMTTTTTSRLGQPLKTDDDLKVLEGRYLLSGMLPKLVR